MGRRSEDVRNVALFGHGNSGKTALVDALAYLTKVSTRHGNSADGTSISNSEAEEKDGSEEQSKARQSWHEGSLEIVAQAG